MGRPNLYASDTLHQQIPLLHVTFTSKEEQHTSAVKADDIVIERSPRRTSRGFGGAPPPPPSAFAMRGGGGSLAAAVGGRNNGGGRIRSGGGCGNGGCRNQERKPPPHMLGQFDEIGIPVSTTGADQKRCAVTTIIEHMNLDVKDDGDGAQDDNYEDINHTQYGLEDGSNDEGDEFDDL